MKEYTLLAALSVIITIIIDSTSGIKVLRRAEFYLYLGSIFIMKLLVNGYLTGSAIVQYRQQFFLGQRVGNIPLEDFLFGFSMVTLVVIFWEYFKKTWVARLAKERA